MRSFSLSRALLLVLVIVPFALLFGQGDDPAVEPPADARFTPIELGERLDGRLDPDERVDSELVDWYEFRMPADTPVEIFLRSNEIDAYLVAILPDGSAIENDDAVGSDSIITTTTEVAGTAVIGVTSYGFAATGGYSLEVSQVDMPVVSVGRAVFGELGSSGRTRYRFRPGSGDVVSFEVRSSAFDTYLEVEGDEELYHFNDDAGSTSRSRLIIPFDGRNQEVMITVSSFGPAEPGAGAFELSVEELNIEPLRYPDGHLLADGESLRSIALPSHGSSEDIASRFRFRATEGERVELELRSADFDSYLSVVTPRGSLYEDDDSAGYPDARLVFVAPETGTYEAFAGAIHRSTAGVFTLGFRRLGMAEMMVNTNGELTSRDEADITGKHYDLYRFSVGRGENLTLEVQSDEFDAYLILRSPDGEILLQDDDGGSGLNSKASFQVEQSGEYELVVTSVSNGSLGSYSVQIYK